MKWHFHAKLMQYRLNLKENTKSQVGYFDFDISVWNNDLRNFSNFFLNIFVNTIANTQE